MIEKEDVKKLALLSRIAISDKEAETLQADIESILGYVSDVKTISSQIIEEELGVVNVMREDGKPHETGMYTDILLQEMPNTEKGYLKVKKIL